MFEQWESARGGLTAFRGSWSHDVVFAVDSVPAILAISREPFFVFVSNTLDDPRPPSALLRLAGMAGKFRYLNIGLGFILGFVGVKMLVAESYPRPAVAVARRDRDRPRSRSRVSVGAVRIRADRVRTCCSRSSPRAPTATTTPTTHAAGDDHHAVAVTTTTMPSVYAATVAAETIVDPAYRQGLARVDDGWIFSLNDGLFRTDDALVQTIVATPAIPPELAARGFNHVGDVDVVDNVLYAPLEQPDYDVGTQIMALYDATTLTLTSSVDVAQHHNSFVTVDPESGIAYSMDMFGGQALCATTPYDTGVSLAPLAMSMAVDRVQGGDVVDGAVWLSTDDATDGVYRVDLETGAVQALGSIGRIDGEGEGIDATPLPSGDLHVLTVDAAIVPVRLIDLNVTNT